MPPGTVRGLLRIEGAALKVDFTSHADVGIVYIEIADIDGVRVAIAKGSELLQNISSQLLLLGVIREGSTQVSPH
jgi:hypothetical protein